MSRPLYETAVDRSREERLALWYANEIGLQARRCPSKYPCDWAMQNKESVIEQLVEVKIRGESYKEYMISLSKVSTIVSYAAYADAKPMLVVYWMDTLEIGYVDLIRCNRRAGFGGRSDRDDPDDIEPCVFIPKSDFTIVPGQLPLFA